MIFCIKCMGRIKKPLKNIIKLLKLKNNVMRPTIERSRLPEENQVKLKRFEMLFY